MENNILILEADQIEIEKAEKLMTPEIEAGLSNNKGDEA